MEEISGIENELIKSFNNKICVVFNPSLMYEVFIKIMVNITEGIKVKTLDITYSGYFENKLEKKLEL